MLIVGIDIGSASVVACVFPGSTDDLLSFSRKYKPIKADATVEGIEAISSLGDIFALEPTGSYHRVWAENLEARGKTVVFCSGTRIRNYARTHGILDKSDRTDAAVIAAYAHYHIQGDNPKAFIELPKDDLRERYTSLKSLPRVRQGLINRLRARLAYELPERAKATAAERPWMESRPSALWREIAGEEVLGGKKRQERNSKTIGRGLSWIGQEIAKIICECERLESRIEREIHELMEDPLIARYSPVFEAWGISERSQAAIVSVIHPIEQFLGSDGRRIVERVWGDGNERTKRDRSLKAFQRAMAFGRTRIQSGDSLKWVSTGDKEVRASMVSFLEFKIAIRRSVNQARLFEFFGKPEEWEDWNKKQRDRWKDDRSFQALTEPKLKGAITAKPNGYKPWKDTTLIQFVMDYNGASEPFARLQLFYEYAPQCQNLVKKRRILKCFPLFIRWLFADLIKVASEIT